MADYIYLLDNRLSVAQRSALLAVRELSKSKGLTVFLVGGAVRDLTSGSPVRDLDIAVQGNVLKLKKDLEKVGAVVTGENEPGQSLFVRFPGKVRMEIGSTLTVTFPKPGKPVVKPASILEDLRRRDFTANAMALSLNDGSYGLLMDPLNGVADIENRQLRLVSNYGFIEDPVRMIRAARLMARLGWTLDDKTQSRYETGLKEGYISVLSDFHRGYETEEIVHEEDPIRVLKRLESEGWMKVLAPFWTLGKANVAELDRLREVQTQLQLLGIHPDPAAANFPLLTAKLSAAEVAKLKELFPRKGFVGELDALESEARDFATQLSGKQAASNSASWKLISAASPEAVLWTSFTSKSAAIQAKLKSFSTDWPQARQKIPFALLTEMRITKDLPGYEELMHKLFYELMDGKLESPEELRAYLEPYSPPAPPPPVSMRRPRAVKVAKTRSRKAVKLEDDDDLDTLEVIAVESENEPESEDTSESEDSPESEPEAQKSQPIAPPALEKLPTAKATTPASKPLKKANVPEKTPATKKPIPMVAKIDQKSAKKVIPKTSAKSLAASKQTATPPKPSSKPAVPVAKTKPMTKALKTPGKSVTKKVVTKATSIKSAAKAPAKKIAAKIARKVAKKTKR